MGQELATLIVGLILVFSLYLSIKQGISGLKTGTITYGVKYSDKEYALKGIPAFLFSIASIVIGVIILIALFANISACGFHGSCI